MSPNSDIRGSQARIEPSSNTDTSIESTPDPNESSDDQSVNQKVIQPWMQLQGTSTRFEIRLHDRAYDLFKLLREALEYALKYEQLPKFIQDIRNFFIDENRSYQLDDCIRWLILDSAVQQCPPGIKDVGFSTAQTETSEETITGETNPCIIIIRFIVEVWPHFPFICLDDTRMFPSLFPARVQELLVGKCCFEAHTPEQKREFPSTPLHRAAGKGNGKAIKHMIHNGQCFQPDDLLQILKLNDPDQRSGKTALSLAAIAGNLGALHALLGFSTDIADTPDTTFEEALRKGKASIVEVFLQQPDLKEKFVNTDYILLAIQPLGEMSIRKGETYDKQVEVVNALIKAADQQGRIDEKVVEKIIQLNLEDIWSGNETIFKSDTPGLLHLAVQHQQIGFVKKFMQYDELVTAQSHNHYPLWHNNNIMEGSTSTHRVLKDVESKRIHKEIRDLIVTATIKSKEVSKMQDLIEIFQLSDVNELCFDLSRLHSEDFSVSDFVHSLIHHQDCANLLSFEETLKYATFPALDLKTDNKKLFGDNIQFDHNEIFKALDWLRNRKKVKHIIELTVLDRLVNPHDEVILGIYVKQFEVEVLNWRLLDLSISVFKSSEPNGKNALQQIRELHLYTSGKRAVISHWLSEDGIRSLTNLTTLEIHVVQVCVLCLICYAQCTDEIAKDLASREKCRATAAFIENEFGKLSEEINEQREKTRQEKFRNTPNAQRTHDDHDTWKLTVGVGIRPWNPTEEREADLGEIAERAVPKLSRFIKGYQTYVRDIVREDSVPFRPTRVAVIDNGILSISPLVETPSAISNAVHIFESSSALNLPESSDINSIAPNGYQNGKGGESKTLWSRIKKGQSFVDDDARISSWLFASDPHGTQMANLICAIDPCCDLYVARVAEGRSGIIPARVERAVKWAISQKVDVISMSFAILEGTQGLADACADALHNGIIILCSTPDEGLNTEMSCISGYGHTMTITACDEFGILAPNAPLDYNYAIKGIDVAAGKVPFLASKDCISGSSVSTAIAAGLSSLILSCDRLARQRQRYERGDRAKIVKHHFAKMAATNKKYIILERFAEIDKKIKDGRYINAKEIIEGFFAEERYSE
ncbi:hypothetical protein MKX08_004137 [Trichoderma sp. CBMAI-0020]|nr:hypothetical protein MKX08_004137 [Trichoderma sp. CBMAI-0020]